MSDVRTVLRNLKRNWTHGDFQDLEHGELRGQTFSWSSDAPRYIVAIGSLGHLFHELEDVEVRELVGLHHPDLPFPDPFSEPSTEELDDTYSA